MFDIFVDIFHEQRWPRQIVIASLVAESVDSRESTVWTRELVLEESMYARAWLHRAMGEFEER